MEKRYSPLARVADLLSAGFQCLPVGVQEADVVSNHIRLRYSHDTVIDLRHHSICSTLVDVVVAGLMKPEVNPEQPFSGMNMIWIFRHIVP